MAEPNVPHDPDAWGLPELGPLTPDSLGVDLEPVYLTRRERRTIFRALRILAWLCGLGFATKLDQPLDINDGDELCRLASTVLPEGIEVTR
jgi:hypothetical protein